MSLYRELTCLILGLALGLVFSTPWAPEGELWPPLFLGIFSAFVGALLAFNYWFRLSEEPSKDSEKLPKTPPQETLH